MLTTESSKVIRPQSGELEGAVGCLRYLCWPNHGNFSPLTIRFYGSLPCSLYAQTSLLDWTAAFSQCPTANVLGDPQIQLISIIFILICNILLKMFITTKIFNRWLIDSLESFFYFNIVFFLLRLQLTTSAWELGNQDVIAYASISGTVNSSDKNLGWKCNK